MARRGRRLHRRLEANIRRLVQDRGVTLLELTGQAGVARPQLYRVFAGEVSPTLAWLERIADALDVDVTELIADERE